MPLAFLAVVGFVLVVLLFSADATWRKFAQASPGAAPALATHVTSEPVQAPLPRAQVAPEDPVTARAEALPTKKRVTRTHPPVEYRRNNVSSYREFGLSDPH